MSTEPTTGHLGVEERPVAIWLAITLAAMLLLAGLVSVVARRGMAWGIKAETLHIAAVHRPEEIVPLIRSGRDVNELMGGRTPLEQAVTFGNIESVRALLLHGADPNLYDPGGTTSPEVASTGVRHSSDPPTGPPLASGHLQLRNPEDRTIILLLLDARADPDTSGTFGETLLHKAAREKDHFLVGRLLALNADVNARDDRGHTRMARSSLQVHRGK